MLIIIAAVLLMIGGIAVILLSVTKTNTAKTKAPLITPMPAGNLRPPGISPSYYSRNRRSANFIKNSLQKQDYVFYHNYEVPSSAKVLSVDTGVSEEKASTEVPPVKVDVVKPENLKIDELAITNGISAVLFEDIENSVSFAGVLSEDDYNRYDKLKRVGCGTVVLNNDSISFHIEKKLFRFDFFRLKDVRGNQNSVLVYPDNLNFPFLVIAENETAFSERVLERYLNFKKGY